MPESTSRGSGRAMTALIVISLVVDKFGGILLMYKFSKLLGFPPPLGICTRHVRMTGLIAVTLAPLHATYEGRNVM